MCQTCAVQALHTNTTGGRSKTAPPTARAPQMGGGGGPGGGGGGGGAGAAALPLLTHTRVSLCATMWHVMQCNQGKPVTTVCHTCSTGEPVYSWLACVTCHVRHRAVTLANSHPQSLHVKSRPHWFQVNSHQQSQHLQHKLQPPCTLLLHRALGPTHRHRLVVVLLWACSSTSNSCCNHSGYTTKQLPPTGGARNGACRLLPQGHPLIAAAYVLRHCTPAPLPTAQGPLIP
jgi:hypothetical protein